MKISDTILDEIFPVPDIDELKAEKVAELKDEGFVITNFNTGGIFNMILMFVLHCRIELIKLIRTILPEMFVSTASETWLPLRAADFSKELKAATKTKGNLTLTRTEGNTDVITIPTGTVFKTEKDIKGDELRYFSLSDVIMTASMSSILVSVEAEGTGSNYNVPVNQITKSLIYLDGISSITNAAGWITYEGSDIEDIESLRDRTLNSWAELSSRPIADKYKNVCESVSGVLYVRVDQMHPRGQGTIDIIVTSTNGEATESLLESVRTAADEIKGEDDNILVKSAVTVIQDLIVNITIQKTASDDGIQERAIAVISNYFKISKDRNLNELIHMDIIYALRNDMSIIKNVKISNPVEDLILDTDKVIILGTVTVNVQREE